MKKMKRTGRRKKRLVTVEKMKRWERHMMTKLRVV